MSEYDYTVYLFGELVFWIYFSVFWIGAIYYAIKGED